MSFKLPKLGFGAGTFSKRYNAIDDTTIPLLIKTSVDNGINYFDTAPYYNDSEIILGEALHQLKDVLPRNQYIISTKLGRYGPTGRDFDYSRTRVRQSVQQSLKRLHTTYLDVVLCHDVEFVSLTEVVDQALPELFHFKAEGIVREVGISGYPLPVLLHIAKVQYERGQPLDVVLSYCHYNLHNQQFRRVAPQFRNWGVRRLIDASPLSMGLFRPQGPPDWHPACSSLREAAIRAQHICEEAGVNLPIVATTFSLDQTCFDCTLVGISNLAELQQALAHYSGAIPTDSEKPRIRTVTQSLLKLFEPFTEYSWPSPPLCDSSS
ncbi:hypothetical protein IWQ61_002891 [Dispira simplex]|nr:hypothetical protein IWQ61_002891 [Dispira simplex]